MVTLYLLVLVRVDVGEEVRREHWGGGVVLPAQHPLRREHPFPLQKKIIRRFQFQTKYLQQRHGSLKTFQAVTKIEYMALINRVHICIFEILKHHGLMPCTRFMEVTSLPA